MLRIDQAPPAKTSSTTPSSLRYDEHARPRYPRPPHLCVCWSLSLPVSPSYHGNGAGSKNQLESALTEAASSTSALQMAGSRSAAYGGFENTCWVSCGRQPDDRESLQEEAVCGVVFVCMKLWVSACSIACMQCALYSMLSMSARRRLCSERNKQTAIKDLFTPIDQLPMDARRHEATTWAHFTTKQIK